MDSLKVWLSNKKTLEAALERASLSIDFHSQVPFEQSDFHNELQAIENQLNLNQEQTDNLDDYSKMIEQLLRYTEQSIYQLNASGTGVLKNYADNGIGKSTAISKALLNFAYQYNFRIIPQIPTNAQQSISNPNFNPNTVLANSQLEVYPNPAKNEVTFSYNLLEDFDVAQILIYNLHGQLIQQFDISDAQGKIAWDIAHLPDGCYYYQFTHDETAAAIQKLIIIK